MRLYYWSGKNFGDELNPWLWGRLIPELLDEASTTTLVGVGTLLNDELLLNTQENANRVIFSTGVGYIKKGLPNAKTLGRIYCVRGLLSAKALGLDAALACGDGAYLVKNFIKPATTKLYKYSYIPHHTMANPGLKNVCKEIGIAYIDPSWEVDRCIRMINFSECVLAEAMHGAIVADALRVPWIPIKSDGSINDFKWQDWLSTLNLQHNPSKISRLYMPSKDDIPRNFKFWIHSKRIEQQFKKIINQVSPILSQESTIDRIHHQLNDRLAQLKTDALTGSL
ncbi:hypothetical protein ACKFKF_17335 [Phormidesmis sp. 146-12]